MFQQILKSNLPYVLFSVKLVQAGSVLHYIVAKRKRLVGCLLIDDFLPYLNRPLIVVHFSVYAFSSAFIFL